MGTKGSRRMRWHVTVALAAMTIATSAQAQMSEHIDIPAASLATTLTAVGRQTKSEIIFAAGDVRGLKAPAIRGDYTPEQALVVALQGSDLSARRTPQGALIIEKSGTRSGESIAGSAAAEVGSAEIVVTAQRREQRLVTVPISVSVLNNSTLESGPINSVNEALRGVPGVAGFVNAQAGMTKFSVRGVTGNSSLFNSGSTIGYYLDEIPFAFVRFPVSPDAGSFDIQRVEVLRGPQGTLYGANSMNGVVRVLTTDANLSEFAAKFRGSVSTTRYGGENYRGDAALNIPIIQDKLAIRVVGGAEDNSGWIRRPSDGQDDINDTKRKQLRIKLNAAPTPDLSVKFLAWYSRDDRDSPANAFRDNRTTRSTIPEPSKTDFDAYNLILNYSFPTFTVLSATSHIKFDSQSIQDGGALGGVLTKIGAKLTSQEVRAVSSAPGPWAWSLGAIYRDARDTQVADFLTNPTPALSGIGDNVFTSKSWAVYGELTRKLLDDRVEVTGGVRYFHDRASSLERAALDPLVIPFGLRKDSFSAWTPRFVLSYHPVPNSTVYASYSQGFRSGFSQNGDILRRSQGLAQAVRPDRLHNYEVGAKGRLFDAVRFDVAAYYIDWKDPVQVIFTNLGTSNAPVLLSGAVNAGRANGFGLDLGITVDVAPRFSVSGTFSVNDLTFAENILSNNAILYAKGTRLPESPKYTASGNIDYSVPLSDRYSLDFAGSLSFTSPMIFGSGATAAKGDRITQVRASTTLRSEDHWSLGLFADNLLNEKGLVRSLGGVPPFGDHLRPQTFGVQLDVDF